MKSKTAFLITVINSFLTIFLIGFNPVMAGWWFLCKFIIAMIYRFTSWKKENQHYFMTEFCYFANIIVISYFAMNRLGYYKNNLELGVWFFRIIFSLSNGPLAMAMVTLGDKLVFHDIQYVISLIIHLAPSLLTWSFRWASPFEEFPEAHMNKSESLLLDNIINDGLTNTKYTMPFYFIWFVLYISTVFIVFKKRIEEKGNVTMYSYLTAGRPNHPINYILNRINSTPIKQLTYMILHLISIVPTMFLSGLWWNSFYLHTGFILYLCISSVYNASTYYDYKLINKNKKD
jgi:hypothetical protein